MSILQTIRSIIVVVVCVAVASIHPGHAATEPAPSTGVDAATPPVAGNDAYAAGLGDRTHWENWFRAQQGERRDGALWWSGERGKPHPGTCEGTPPFVSGCLDAKAILTASDTRRRSEPDYRRGWNSYAAADTTPQQAAAPDPATLAPHDDPAAWRDGLRDRTQWEQWFESLEGDRRAGALYWSGERSKPTPGSCFGSADFESGCEEAKRRLAGPDYRRLAERDYWRGWNSYGLDTGPHPETDAGGSPPSRPPSSGAPKTRSAGAPECADFGTFGTLCVRQTEGDIAAAIGTPLAKIPRRCGLGTATERDCHAWYYVRDCRQYILIFDNASGNDWRVVAAGFNQAATPEQTRLWCDAHD